MLGPRLTISVFLLMALVDNTVSNPANQSLFDKFFQTDYEMKFERVETVSFNKHIVRRFETHFFKYNRTCTAVNLTMQFNVDLGNNLEFVTQMYKFMSNEYRLFPARVQVNGCLAISKNLGGLGSILTCRNVSGGCPALKGITYHGCNWVPDGSRMPPLMPNGRYMLESQALYGSTEVAVVRAYGEVFRPIVIPD